MPSSFRLSWLHSEDNLGGMLLLHHPLPVVPNQTCTSKSAIAHFPLEQCRWKKASQPLLILDLETPEQDSQRVLLLALCSMTPLSERLFHGSHLGPSENTDVCVTVYHSSKVTVMKEQQESFYS